MNHRITQFNYFEPVDMIAETQIQVIDQIKDPALRDFRLHFLSEYDNSTAIDPKQKEWKKLISQKSIQHLTFAGNPTLKEFASQKMPGSRKEYAGAAHIEEDHISYWIREDYRKKEVRFCHFDQAIQDQLFTDEHLEQIKNTSGRDRFSLLTLGASKHSLCVSIPENLEVEQPFLIRINHENPYVIMPVVINVIAGKRSSVELIIEIASTGSDQSPMILPIEYHVFAEDSSKVDLIENQKTHLKAQLFPHQQFFLKDNASLNYLVIEQGGEVVKRKLSVQLEGKEAAAVLTGLYTLSGKQKFIFDTQQNHLASKTMSNLLFKGVLGGGSYSLWKGNVFVAKDTQGVDGYQMNNNLLLDSSAQAESIPGLEIFADDVRCSHGVTISDIDSDQLFYLKSRGIDEIAGKKLIVDGYSRGALQRVRSKELRDYAIKELGFGEEF
jgi:Fe-S cluster assembly protein SufD